MQVTVEVASSRLSELIDVALNGEEVFIAKEGRPVVQLVPLPKERELVGALEGKLTVPDGLFGPMSKEELKDWGGT